MKEGLLTIKSAISHFLMNILELSSNRVKLIWFSAFSWATAHLWYGVMLPLVREISIIYYRQNEIHGTAIDLNSPYAQSILNSTDMAFTGIVVAYVASNWKNYSSGLTGNSKTDPPSKTEEEDTVEEK